MADLAALRTSVALKLNDQNNRIISVAQIDALLNEAQRHWARKVESLRREYAFPLTIRQYDYPSPSDILRIYSAWYEPVQGQELEVINYSEFVSRDYHADRQVSIPISILEDGEGAARRLRVWPAPNRTSLSSTVVGSVGTGDTTIPVTDVTQFRSQSGWVLIDGLEQVLYQEVDTATNELRKCRRALGGTAAASYIGGETVQQCDIHIIYGYRPAVLVNPTDVPEIREEYHEDLVHYVMWHALAFDGRRQEAGRYFGHWQQALVDAKRMIRRAEVGGPNTFLDTYY